MRPGVKCGTRRRDRDVGSSYGVVLCGGRSSRMGQDKALLRLGGRTLLERSVEVLSGFCERVFLACGPEERYGEMGLQLLLDPEVEQAGSGVGQGPLVGLLAGLEAVQREAVREARPLWLAVLAVDLVRASGALFEQLLTRARSEGADACLFATEDGLEPLLGVYRTTCLAAVRAAVAAGERRLVGFHRGYGALNIVRLEEHELPRELGVREPARNVNSPGDFLQEGGRLP